MIWINIQSGQIIEFAHPTLCKIECTQGDDSDSDRASVHSKDNFGITSFDFTSN